MTRPPLVYKCPHPLTSVWPWAVQLVGAGVAGPLRCQLCTDGLSVVWPADHGRAFTQDWHPARRQQVKAGKQEKVHE